MLGTISKVEIKQKNRQLEKQQKQIYCILVKKLKGVKRISLPYKGKKMLLDLKRKYGLRRSLFRGTLAQNTGLATQYLHTT
jgi:hypothetical protein